MRIYGSSQNVALFTKNILSVLEEAGMDYMKALPFLEIYLGTVFSDEASTAKDNQIFEMEMESYYELYGEKAVAAGLNLYFWQKLGRIVQKTYLPCGSARWGEMEMLLGRKLDFNEYYFGAGSEIYIPAVNLAIQLFRHTVAGEQEIVILQINGSKKEFIELLGREVLVPGLVHKKALKLNPHAWRKWYYSLWGQVYEWGCFQINQKTAEANGKYYHFSLPPQRINKINVVPARELLEAHDYRVNISNDGKVEYWR